MPGLDRPTRRQFVSTAALVAGSALFQRHVLAQPAQVSPVITPGMTKRPVGKQQFGAKIQPFPLSSVRLKKGPFLDALEADRHYLHLLPSDRLLHTFRLNAGIPSSAEPLEDGKSLIASCAVISRVATSCRHAL